jgi:hypothetical protein
MRRWLACFAATSALLSVARAQDNDVVIRAMHDELERARMFRVASPDPPYYVEYEIEDADVVAINASLGALISENHSGIKVPSVRVRLGTPAFDNANYVFSDYFTGTRMDPAELPLDTTYGTVRQILWLATDRAFKTAEEGIGRKRSALKNVNLTENLPDYSAAPAIQSVSAIRRTPVDEAAWKNRIVKLSGIFANYPAIDSSGIEFQTIQGTTYLANTEGANLRYSEDLTFLRARAFTQAPDGMVLRDAEVFHSDELSLFPSELDLKRGITAVADELTALTKAPVGETYDGPVLLEPRAAAQLFAQVSGRQPQDRAQAGAGARPKRAVHAQRAGNQGGGAHPAGLDGRCGRSHPNRMARAASIRPLHLRHGRRKAPAVKSGGEGGPQDLSAHPYAGDEGL